MATKANSELGNFVSTMLISKPHKKENYKLSNNILYTLMHPNLSRIPYSFFSFSMTVLNVITGIIVVLLLNQVGLTDPVSILLGFVFGYILMYYILKKYFNKAQAGVSELNTFIIASKSINSNSKKYFNSPEHRVNFENRIKYLHDAYKKEIFSIVRSEVKQDYEFKYSVKTLRNVSKELGVTFDIDSAKNVQNWVDETLEKLYKGTRISYWNNQDGKYRLVVTNLNQERQFAETKEDISDIIDELNLLIFSNHYREAIEPLFMELSQNVDPLLDKGFCRQINGSGEHDENFSECIRVLLSKVLGMQEVLKSTKRQFERLNEAKKDLEIESKDINSQEFDAIVNHFSINGTMAELIKKLQNLSESLSQIALGLRTIDFDNVKKPNVESFKAISDLYFALEKLRFISAWFEDIASYTNISNGSISGFESTEEEEIPADVVLRARDVFKTFNTSGGTVYAVRGVSFDIKAGEFIGLFGPSGSGKTTLLNIMAGLDKTDSGDIFIEGQSLKSLSEGKLTTLRRDKMGFIFQFYNLIPILKNKENVSYPADISGSKNAKQASVLLKSVQLSQFDKQYPNKLSGGQMQRVTIARSLINTPKILFADEPTGDLDSVTGKEIMELLAKFNHINKTTIIFVTHDKSLLSYCTRVINMTDGQIMS